MRDEELINGRAAVVDVLSQASGGRLDGRARQRHGELLVSTGQTGPASATRRLDPPWAMMDIRLFLRP